MRYFLKKTNRPKGEYLQIYQSEYIRGVGSRNKSYKAIGYVDELVAKGIKDPAAKAQAEEGPQDRKELTAEVPWIFRPQGCCQFIGGFREGSKGHLFCQGVPV